MKNNLSFSYPRRPVSVTIWCCIGAVLCQFVEKWERRKAGCGRAAAPRAAAPLPHCSNWLGPHCPHSTGKMHWAEEMEHPIPVLRAAAELLHPRSSGISSHPCAAEKSQRLRANAAPVPRRPTLPSALLQAGPGRPAPILCKGHVCSHKQEEDLPYELRKK